MEIHHFYIVVLLLAFGFDRTKTYKENHDEIINQATLLMIRTPFFDP